MNDVLACPISGESPQEERLNFLTHFFGFLLSVVGAILVIYASTYCNFWCMVGYIIYGSSLVLLYGASSFYHRCQHLNRKRFLKLVDHICIYLLIAGTYTPFALGPLRESGGWNLFFMIWGMAAAGIIFKIFAIDRFEKFSVFFYLAMGWLIVFSFSTLVDTVSLTTLICLFMGGCFYSLGTIFYLWHALPYNHSIWHLFVLGGSASHYFSVLQMIG